MLVGATMTTVSRTRDRPYGHFNGPGTRTVQQTVWGNPTTPSVATTTWNERGHEYCSDELTIAGRRNPNFLDMEKAHGDQWRLNGRRFKDSGYKTTTVTYDEWIPNRYASGLGYTSYPIELRPLGSWGNEIISNLAVNDVVVDVPLFLFELHELPRMLHDLGRFQLGHATLRDVPGSFLSYNFGWRPLLSDLTSLLDLQESIQDRLRYLTDISRARPIHRTLRREEWTAGSSEWNADSCFDVRTTERRKLRTWFTARVGPIDSEVQRLQTLYRRALTGNSADMAEVRGLLTNTRVSRRLVDTIWNAVPWTWLIDYFVSIGDFIEASNGLIPFQPRDICVMEHHEYTRNSEVIRSYADSYDEFSVEFESDDRKRDIKMRQPYLYLSPQIRFKPFLTGRQQSILGALALASSLERGRWR